MNENLIQVKNNSKAVQWNLQDGYAKSIPYDPETYPYRVYSPGQWEGLMVLLRLHEPDLDVLCRGSMQGFKMILHPPSELPQVSDGFRIPNKQEFFVAIRPSMIKTSEGLRDYDPNRRQCFFNSERYLRFFKVYSQRSCELECLSNFTKAECGCVKFSMPRESVYNSNLDFSLYLLKYLSHPKPE